jgi:superfamily II DNA or RNA helicase/HKD family nuclease
MSEFLKQLSESLYTGFVDINKPSKPNYVPQLLVNNKEKGKKVLTTIENELLVCDNFWFSVAFVTTSGVASLINTLKVVEEKGKFGKILVSKYLNFTQPEALARLIKIRNIEVKIAVEGDFHSKGYLFRNGLHYNLIIGSSNLTANALSVNKELNLKISATPESAIINSALKEFSEEFEKAVPVDVEFIENYRKEYNNQLFINKRYKELFREHLPSKVQPNKMQVDALRNIDVLRKDGKDKALLISATGTGKTYLSAFDVKAYQPKRFLFVVHRLNIINAAITTYQEVFGNTKTFGIYSGNSKELESDYVFSTIQTLSIQNNLAQFSPDQFDYIVIDETHRAGAESYQRVINYFKPKFLLGMTATPERTDGLDVFKLFNYNIAYEIRLHKALEMQMVSPFHYYGVTDILVDGERAIEAKDFNKLASKNRVNHIIEKAGFYGTDNGVLRGLVFCSSVEECKILSRAFNQLGFKTVALSGENNEEERSDAINRLESEEIKDKLDYIFTYDIFNEGIDIPKVNQVILLRPTQSAIIFVQQLGRGIRKIDSKDYLTVIDFIGNYKNNYLVPIALYGDNSYNKDTLRKLISGKSSFIPGSSTINFDEITKGKIFESINTANMQQKKDLIKDYRLLKYELGRIPMMIDFEKHGSRDPKLYINSTKSYFNFVAELEPEYNHKINQTEKKLLELFSNEINNAKRLEESLILSKIIINGVVSINEILETIFQDYGIHSSLANIDSAINNLNFGFVTENKNKKLIPVKDIYGFDLFTINNDLIVQTNQFHKLVQNKIFNEFLGDNIKYALFKFKKVNSSLKYNNGFHLYQKYSRKDVFRIMNWPQNPVAQNVGGYMISADKTNCPIFVTYHKADHISDTTKYDDGFETNTEFKWMSKSNRTLSSPDVKAIINTQNPLRLPLFVKKDDGEGADFYYMGELKLIDGKYSETRMEGENNAAVVKINFSITPSVDDNIYQYLTETI